MKEQGVESTRDISFRQLGWGFLLAWVFSVFYAGTGVPTTVDRMSVDIPFALHATFLLVPVAVAVVTLIVLVAGERRFGTVAQSRWGVATSSVLACSGTLIMTIPGYNPVQGSVLYLVGGILAGVGSGMMWVMWGQYYALIGQDKVETLAPVSAVMASVLVLLASAMEGIVGMVYIAGLVLCSGVCFAICWRDVAQQEVSADHALAVDKQAMVRAQHHAVDHPMRVLRTMGRSGFGILIACLCVSVVGSLLPIQDEQAVLQISLVLSLVLLVVVGIVSTRGPRRMTIGFAYRWMCPVLVVVLVGIIVLPMETAGDFAYGVSLALRLALCLITQVYFAGFAAHGLATPTQSYGFGWIFVHLGGHAGGCGAVDFPGDGRRNISDRRGMRTHRRYGGRGHVRGGRPGFVCCAGCRNIRRHRGAGGSHNGWDVGKAGKPPCRQRCGESDDGRRCEQCCSGADGPRARQRPG